MWMFKICCFGKLTPVMVCSAGGTSFVIWEVRTNVGRRNSDSYQIYLWASELRSGIRCTHEISHTRLNINYSRQLLKCFLKLSGKINDMYGLDRRGDFCQGNKLDMKSVYLLGKVSKSTLQCHQMSPAFPGRPFRHIKSGAKSASSTFFPSTHLHSTSRLDFEKHCYQGKMSSYFFLQISKRFHN